MPFIIKVDPFTDDELSEIFEHRFANFAENEDILCTIKKIDQAIYKDQPQIKVLLFGKDSIGNEGMIMDYVPLVDKGHKMYWKRKNFLVALNDLEILKSGGMLNLTAKEGTKIIIRCSYYTSEKYGNRVCQVKTYKPYIDRNSLLEPPITKIEPELNDDVPF